MASRKFRFVSPGVFLKEIDNSQLPGIPDAVGPAIIGRTRKGPALTPYKIKSLEEFERVFGNPMPGNEGEDPWRNGTDLLAESYAPYAARAYLSADIESPVTVVRLAGIAGDDASGEDAANPGWKSVSSYGLFLFTSGSGISPAEDKNLTGSLAAVFYGDNTFTASLYGTPDLWFDDSYVDDTAGKTPSPAETRQNALIRSDSNGQFTIRLQNTSAARKRDVSFSFDSSLREGFNTNPIKTNDQITDTESSLADLYWLGETFEENYKEIDANKGTNDALVAMVLKLDPTMSDFKSANHGLNPAKSGWFISQDKSGASIDVEPKNAPRLFRVIARQEGFQATKEIMISIERINIARDNATDPYSSFSLIVNEIRGTRLIEVERFDNVNLNPSSENYIAKKIGDQYYKWSQREGRNKLYGTNANISEYIRVEMHPNLLGKPPEDPSLVPFGFLGPIVPDDITSTVNSSGKSTLAGSKWVANASGGSALDVSGLTTHTSSILKLSWPSIPLVNSASLSDGFMVGASPFKQAWGFESKHTTETILNPGYVDYLRRYPTYTGLTTDQDSGEDSNTNTKFSFIFTMDDVILHPKPGLEVSGIETAGDIVLAEYVSGSRNGISKAASATLSVVASAEPHGMTAGQKITLISPLGGAPTRTRSYVLVDPALSDVDKTATRSTVNPIAANSQLGGSALVSTTKGKLDGALTGAGAGDGHKVDITVPAIAGGAGSAVRIKIEDGSFGADVDHISIKLGDAAFVAQNIVDAINGNAVDNRVALQTQAPGNAGVAGITAELGANNTVNISFDRGGAHGTVTLTDSGGSVMKSGAANSDVPAGTEITGTEGDIAVHMDGTQANVLANLRAAILSADGHDGEILFDDSAIDGTLTLRQKVSGQSGETAIAEDITNLSSPLKFTDSGIVSSFAKSIADGQGPSAGLRTMADIVDGFRAPLIAGFDGVDITEADPFNNRVLSTPNSSTKDNYAFASVDRAIKLISDAEAVEHNLAVMPGITNESLTTKLVRACESRGDSLAIIDLPDIYVPPFQKKCDNFEQRIVTTPERAAKALTNRQLNSSYGATYYPWVKIKDEVYNRDVWVPPSVVALGVMAFTEERDEVWFAPAGFNRGGLNEGNSGVPVLQVTEQLMSRDRDTLYAANINPIASFVSEGIVVFGQKTLQTTQSALDRINVRRLLIFVKKAVSRISKDLLFEQNVRATWNKFLGQVNPFLEGVKTRFGLSDYKVILDSTTTTPDLVDRNILYAKVLLKPARAIEFIAVDFVITNTGASFED